jgi:hypothetical protein
MIRRVLGAGLRITMSEVRVGVPLAYTSSSSSMIPECKCSQNGSRRRTHRTMYERNTAASPLERAGVRLEYAEERHGRASYAMRVGPFRELKGAGWGASPLLFKKELNNDPPSPRGRPSNNDERSASWRSASLYEFVQLYDCRSRGSRRRKTWESELRNARGSLQGIKGRGLGKSAFLIQRGCSPVSVIILQ